MAAPKIHLVLRGNALCDFQNRDGGRIATTSAKEFEQIAPDDRRILAHTGWAALSDRKRHV
jgi:hypothetical protein